MRGSRTVLREPEGEVPLGYSPMGAQVTSRSTMTKILVGMMPIGTQLCYALTSESI